MKRQTRRSVAKAVLNLTGGVAILVLGLWAVLGTLATVVAAFTGGVLTFGLGVWPITILGILFFWGPWYLGSVAAGSFCKTVNAWAEREDPNPKADRYRAALEALWEQERRDAMWPSRHRLQSMTPKMKPDMGRGLKR